MTSSAANIFQGPSGVIPVVNSQGLIYEEVQVAILNQVLFTLATFQYTTGTKTIEVYKNGVMLRRGGVEYTETSATQVTLVTPCAAGDKITFRAYAVSTILAPLQNNGVIPAGANGQVLAKNSNSDYDLKWLSLSSLATLLDQPRVNVASAPTVDVTGLAGTTRNIQITGTTQIDGFAISNGQLFAVKFQSALTLSNNAAVVTQTGAALSVAANDTCLIRATADNVVEILCYSKSAVNLTSRSNVRQTVQAAPTAAGVTAPGGATGATTVTTTNINAATPWVINAAGGSLVDRIGISTANMAYTGLNTNGTMYLFNTVNADGSIVTSTSALAPIYQESGARSITNGQFTFNVSEMYATVGTGAAAPQSYTVCVGEVTVAGGVVTAITWYALNGRYDSGFTATVPVSASVQTAKTHNLGLVPEVYDFCIEATTADLGWNIGTRFKTSSLFTSDGTRVPILMGVTKSVIFTELGTTGVIAILNSGGAAANITAANWKYKFTASRGW